MPNNNWKAIINANSYLKSKAEYNGTLYQYSNFLEIDLLEQTYILACVTKILTYK
jgi:hypothetical protein